MNANLDNYDGLTNPRKHMQNVRSVIKFMTQKSAAICKNFPVTFRGSPKVWYHSLELSSILGLHDLYIKLISYFSTNILIKKSMTKLFTITK
jgi:hypothetical protein